MYVCMYVCIYVCMYERKAGPAGCFHLLTPKPKRKRPSPRLESSGRVHSDSRSPSSLYIAPGDHKPHYNVLHAALFAEGRGGTKDGPGIRSDDGKAENDGRDDTEDDPKFLASSLCLKTSANKQKQHTPCSLESTERIHRRRLGF